MRNGAAADFDPPCRTGSQLPGAVRWPALPERTGWAILDGRNVHARKGLDRAFPCRNNPVGPHRVGGNVSVVVPTHTDRRARPLSGTSSAGRTMTGIPGARSRLCRLHPAPRLAEQSPWNEADEQQGRTGRSGSDDARLDDDLAERDRRDGRGPRDAGKPDAHGRALDPDCCAGGSGT